MEIISKLLCSNSACLCKSNSKLDSYKSLCESDSYQFLGFCLMKRGYRCVCSLLCNYNEQPVTCDRLLHIQCWIIFCS